MLCEHRTEYLTNTRAGNGHTRPALSLGKEVVFPPLAVNNAGCFIVEERFVKLVGNTTLTFIFVPKILKTINRSVGERSKGTTAKCLLWQQDKGNRCAKAMMSQKCE